MQTMAPTYRRHGGRPCSKSKKQFSHYVGFGTVDPNTLPHNGLGRRPLFPVKDQGETEFCTAFATAAASEYQEKIELAPEYSAAKIGQLSGRPITQGADKDLALKAGVEYGFLAKEDSPFLLADKDPEFIADWNNWPKALDLKAAPHEKESYFDALTGPHDLFDNLRAALYLARGDEGVVIATTQWFGSFNQNLNQGALGYNGMKGCAGPAINPYDWHDWDIIDWDFNSATGEPELVCQTSYGQGYGDHGVFYLDRKTTNDIFSVSGAGASIYRDLGPDVVKNFQLHNQALRDIFFELFSRVLLLPQLNVLISRMFPNA